MFLTCWPFSAEHRDLCRSRLKDGVNDGDPPNSADNSYGSEVYGSQNGCLNSKINMTYQKLQCLRHFKHHFTVLAILQKCCICYIICSQLQRAWIFRQAAISQNLQVEALKVTVIVILMLLACQQNISERYPGCEGWSFVFWVIKKKKKIYSPAMGKPCLSEEGGG